MAKPSRSKDSSDDSTSYSSALEEAVKDQVNDDEKLEAVARTADDSDDDEGASNAAAQDDDDIEEDDAIANEVAKCEKARLKEMQRMKKRKIQQILDVQNAAIDANMNNKRKGHLNYLLQQTKLFAHFANGDESTPQKAAKGRGRHASKITEEEEDEECLKEEEDGLSGTGNTRLVAQPSCIQGKMRDYQLAGLNWLIRLYENGINGILADEMGLGKTLQTISLMGYLHEFRGITGPHMVFASKSTLGNWMNEIKRFCPVLCAVEFLGNPEERTYIREELLVAGKFDVCVTSFEIAIKEKSALWRFGWRYIIIDEAHRIKNENSLLSKTMGLYNTNYRLLITGTPLQNNLHELWALLNFLLPEIFSSAETFDEWFQISGDNDEQEVVQQLHKVLRPFLLRRLKSDVEKGLPPKKETILKVGMSQMQKQYYRALLQKDLEVVNAGGEHKRFLNIAMQLRKCYNHPYLLQGAEPGPPYTTGDNLIENAGKMVLLDKLLPKLKERDSRVLIFSQMTKLLDILEDYLMYSGYYYCRIDGNTGGEDRDASIEAFNSPGSEKFVFLLSTRAGGLVINRATADVVILYDSNWNPQIDLQSQDRAHRIGQKKEVQVFRFCTKYTIEEKVIERAYKKLALDALVIQQGRLAEQKTVNKDELLQMVRFGAEMVFISKDSTITNEDIGRIIAEAEGATAELDAKMKKSTEDAIRFKMDDTADLYDFDDEKDENKFDFKKIVSDNWIEPPKRERKRNHSESEYFKQTMRQSVPARPKGMERRGCLIIAIFVCLFTFSSCRELKVTVMHKHNQTDKHDHLATYNHTLATILVQYASAVYLSDLTELFTWTCSRCDGLTEGFEMIELIVDVKRCLQGFVGFAADLNATVIAFRGTQETSIQNWVEDLYWKQLDIDYPGVDGAMVHHGFYSAYHNTSLRPGVLSALQKSKELYGHTKIMVTGHSMGGAMAAFCGLDLRLSLGEQNVQVMTFGQPRIGNAVFASYFNQLVLETIRVTHGHDIVPHLPPYYYYFPKKTYRHFPREVWIYTAALGSFVYTVEKVCDGSGEDPTCSRSVSGNSINDHLTYYGVQMGCDESSSCRIVMDPRLVAYSRRDADGNLILSRDPSVPILKLSTDGDQSSTLV